MTFENHIREIEGIIGYRFRDPSLLKQAFTRASYCNEVNPHAAVPYQSNEVPEFFGDTVLSCAIITVLLRDEVERYEHGLRTKLAEGGFSNIKSKLSDKTNLSRSMRELGLQKYLLLGRGDEKNDIAEEQSVMEDLFESIVAAIYIDAGYDIATVIRSVEKMLDMSVYRAGTSAPIQSYKNALQEYCADKKRKWPQPVYEKIAESGPDHKKEFTCAVSIGDKRVGTGVGKNLKAAETAAAEDAYRKLTKSEEKKSAPKAKPVKINAEAGKELRRFADEKKIGKPEYRDLGETSDGNGGVLYRIECRIGEKSADATAFVKSDARALASQRLLAMLRSGDAEEKGIAAAKKQKPAHNKASFATEKTKKAKNEMSGKKSGGKKAPKKKNVPNPAE